MEKNRIAAITQNEEEQMLLVRVCDKIERAMQREMPAATAFLSLHEQALVTKLLPSCRFFGGSELAQRKVACYLPDYLSEEAYFFYEDSPLACIRAEFYEENALTHRDVLGALMGCGIRRDAVGDICVRENACDIFILSELSRYLLDNLTSAGRYSLKLSQIPLQEAVLLPPKLRELRITVSSLRLDGVLSAAFHLSRGETAEQIRAGRAEQNSLTCLKPDRAVAVNDELSLRGCGKLKILGENGETRKGRIYLNIGIYE